MRNYKSNAGYSWAGTKICQGRSGDRDYEFQDARTYARPDSLPLCKWGTAKPPE